MELVTTNIRLERDLYRLLREKSFKEGKSIACLIREALEKIYSRRNTSNEKEFQKSLSKIVGIGKGAKDSSRHHDQIYLRD